MSIRSRVAITSRGVLGLFVAGLLTVSQPGRAQGADDQYDVTISMEMTGVPMAMPPISQRLCVKNGGSESGFVPHQENCRVSDTTRAGPRLTFKIACAGKDAMSGTGDFTFDTGGYNGQIRLKGMMEGQETDMVQRIAARRSGACTAR